MDKSFEQNICVYCLNYGNCKKQLIEITKDKTRTVKCLDFIKNEEKMNERAMQLQEEKSFWKEQKKRYYDIDRSIYGE